MNASAPTLALKTASTMADTLIDSGADLGSEPDCITLLTGCGFRAADIAVDLDGAIALARGRVAASGFARFPLVEARDALISTLSRLVPPRFDVYAGVGADDFRTLGTHLNAVTSAFDAYASAIAEEAATHVAEIAIDPAEHRTTVRTGTFDDLFGLIMEEADRRAPAGFANPDCEHSQGARELGLKTGRTS